MKITLALLLLSLTLLAQSGGPERRPAPEIEGLIEPYEVVDVSSAVDGLLETIEVRRGDLVDAGQPLARLESSVEQLTVELALMRATAQAGLAAARARLAVDQNRRERYEGLFEKNVVSLDELEEARARHELSAAELQAAVEEQLMAEVEMQRASAALALRTIRSPIDGVVVERYLDPGELVNRTSQAEIVRVARIDPLRVEVIAPIALLGAVEKGMRAEILPEEPIGGVYPAVVTVVDQIVDAASGTFGIRLELPNPHHTVPAGLQCRVRFLD